MSSKDLVQSSFKYHLAFMKVFGLYPFDSWPEIYKTYCFVFYVIFTFTAPLLAITYLIEKGEHSIEAISQTGFMIVELTILTVKVLPSKINPEGTKRTVFTLNREIFSGYLPEQEKILAETVANCRLVFQIYCTSCVFTVSTWACAPLIYEERSFPIALWLPFDPFQNTAIFLSLYIFLVLCVVNAAVSNTTVDSLLAFLIYHAATQIRVLKDTLVNLKRRAEDQVANEGQSVSIEEKERMRNEIIYRKICQCIDHYDAIFEFVEDLESTYSFVVFSQMIASIIILCICCVHFSVVTPLTIPFFGTMTFTVAALLEIFMYCYSGTILYEESNSLINSIYISEWYTYDEKSKKALLILMERAKRPIRVTAGKLLDLSLATFVMIIRRSYSLVAVLKNY